jgi:hypothetical protein
MAGRALVGMLAVHLVTAAVAAALSTAPQPDFDRYWQIASGAGVPYRDYQVEHPIGTLLVFKGLAALAGTRARFAIGVVVANAIADAAIVAALFWAWGITAAAAFAIGALPVLPLLVNRIDLWSIAAATLAVAAWTRRRPLTAGTSLAVGASLKLWPLILAAAFFVPGAGRRTWLATGVFAAVSTALLGVWWALAGSHAFYQVLTFRGATGWQIESTIGSVLHMLRARPIRLESGAWRIGTTSGPISIILFVVAAPLSAALVWWGGFHHRMGCAWLAGVSLLLLLSALFSAQYIGWLLPAAAIAWGEGDRQAAALTWCAVLLTAAFMLVYRQVVADVPVALVLVVIRNIVVVLIVAASILAIRRPRPVGAAR